MSVQNITTQEALAAGIMIVTDDLRFGCGGASLSHRGKTYVLMSSYGFTTNHVIYVSSCGNVQIMVPKDLVPRNFVEAVA